MRKLPALWSLCGWMLVGWGPLMGAPPTTKDDSIVAEEGTPAPPSELPTTADPFSALFGVASLVPEMLGDGAPRSFLLPLGARGVALVPSVRGFNIADNESPRPQDRVYFSSNYFDNLNAAVNRGQGANLSDLRAYRETFGLEKSFFDGSASVGLRLPLTTVSMGGVNQGETSTGIGDLAVIFKCAFLRDEATGDVMSAGLAVVAPTGPDRFAGFESAPYLHRPTLQPFVGGIRNIGRFYLQGFTALDVPTDARDVTMFYKDVGVGYFLYRNSAPGALLTAIVPTAELHMNTPLTHRGVLRSTDPAATPEVVNLTFGTNIEFSHATRLAIGAIAPVTGPRPFDFGIIAQLRYRF